MQTLLRGVSRSFYLSVKILPEAVRMQVALGYLVARAADTIADTPIAPPAERRELLGLLLDAVEGRSDGRDLWPRLRHLAAATGTDEAERQLLSRLSECLALFSQCGPADQVLLRKVLRQLLSGMDRDLSRFPAANGPVPPAQVVALESLADLDEYTYFAAGCVGEFWTDLTSSHLPEVAHLRAEEVRQRGVALGKALQMVNVIRDAPADLRVGRCYWPRELLSRHGLSPQDLAALAHPGAPLPGAESRQAILALTRDLIERAGDLVRTAWPYVQAIPAGALRLRLACIWPLWLGLLTLLAIERTGSPLLLPARPVKIRRHQVYGLVARSSTAALFDLAMGRSTGGRLDRLHERMQQALA